MLCKIRHSIKLSNIVPVFVFLIGVICSWSDGGFLEVDLRHCQHPVAYHVLLTYPAFHISKASLNLTQGDEKTLFKHELVTIKIKVTKLERKENVVTTTVSGIPNNSFPATILIFHKN